MQLTGIFIQTIIGGIGIGSLYALVALGYSMVYRAMGLVNFAHGSIYMVGTYFGIIWYRGMVLGWHAPYPVAFIIGLLLSAVLGFVLERIFRPLAKLDLMFMLLGTIGLGNVLDNLFIIIFGAEGFAVNSPLPSKAIKLPRHKDSTSDTVTHCGICCSDDWIAVFSGKRQNRQGDARISHGS